MEIEKTQQYSRDTIYDILTDIGYQLRPDGRGWRTNALYRNGNNGNSLKINENGTFKDFKTGEYGSIGKLVELTVGKDNAKKLLGKVEDLKIERHESNAEFLEIMKTIDKSFLLKLKDDHQYWISRGISKDVIEKFRGGEFNQEGRFQGRYVFPIFNGKGDIVGLSGRLLKDSDYLPKWKHYNKKKEWKYPLFLNYKIIKESQSVIIVESIGDCLSLFECGIKNVVVSFGLEVSFELMNLFMRYDLQKIYVAFNNDKNNEGNKAAKREVDRMKRFFSAGCVKYAVPDRVGEDFNSILRKEKKYINKWYRNL